jgi:hypothetical protein
MIPSCAVDEMANKPTEVDELLWSLIQRHANVLAVAAASQEAACLMCLSQVGDHASDPPLVGVLRAGP